MWGTSSESEPVLTSFLEWIAENHAYSTILFLPLFSLASYIAFKKYNYNFFEHFVLNAYLTGQQAIIYSVFLLIQYVGDIEVYYFPMLSLSLSIVFAFWTFIQFFESASKINSFIRILITYLLYFLIIISILLAGMLVNHGVS